MAAEAFHHVIDGDSSASVDGASMEVIDPFTRRPWATAAVGGRTEVELAVGAARRAFERGDWSGLAPARRRGVLRRWADLVEASADEIARRDTHDMGKPFRESVNDVGKAAEAIRRAADDVVTMTAETFPMGPHRHSWVDHVPAGVVAVVSPWNGPTNLSVKRIAPALAWGNTVVAKPAEDTPSSAPLVAELALKAGLPAGVLNVVQGFGAAGAGEWLVASPKLDRIAFTGESSTGAQVASIAARNLVPVSAECGGKGPSIVFPDVDVDTVVGVTVPAAFRNSGQVCMAGTRLLLHRSIRDRFLKAFVAAAETWRAGDPWEDGTDLGPLASEAQFERVCGYLETIDGDGGRLLTGGRDPRGGWFIRPTVVVGLPAASSALREEIFGPVVVVQTFEEEDEAIRLAHDHEYGLSAAVFTEDLRRAHRCAERIRAGTVWVNTFGTRDPRGPFGGFARSGMLREGGRASRDFYTEARTLVMEVG